jgi:cobalamin-dependent methionine synthase I
MMMGGGPLVEVFGGAEEFAVCLCTVGEIVDQKISEYSHSENKQIFKAMILDSLGSWAVGQVREQMVNKIKEYFAKQKKRTSIALSPGESSWTIQDQKKLFSLVNANSIGLSLNDSMLMVPMKSISFTMGAGKNKLGMETGSRCKFCLMKEKCDHNELLKHHD